MAKVFTKTVELEANSKPIWYKRVIASAFDIVLLVLFSYLLYFLAFKTPIATNANYYREQMTIIEDDAKLVTGYGYKVETEPGKQGNYLLHYDEMNDVYYIVKNTQYPSKEIVNEYKTLLKNNELYNEYNFSFLINNYGMVIGCGFVSELIFLFVIPVTNKRRATLGQLLCGIRVISTKRLDKAAWYQLLGRLAFIFFIESVIPFLVLGTWIILAVPAITLVIRLLVTNNRSLYEMITFTRQIENSTFVPPYEEMEEKSQDEPSE